jgi:HAD superfamily phosphatase (TIGR01668 family)
MAVLPIPDLMENNIYTLTPEVFIDRGVKLVLLDVDNTIAAYTDSSPTESLLRWAERMRAGGLTLFLLSNNRGPRPEIFARALGISYVKKAWKPFPKVMRQVMAQEGVTGGETALVGDQIYTDALCAKLCGAMAVVVHPIAFSNVLLAFRFGLEFPFRLAYRLKARRSKRTGKEISK